MNERGLFIVMEGTDGSGTTTQGNMLAATLAAEGHTVVRTSEPSSGSIGWLLRDTLRSRAERPLSPEIVALLFAADRMDHCDREIGPALERGDTVICDRYLGSSLAFQVVDGGGAFDAAWVRELNRAVLVPDLSILFDVPVEAAMERIERRGKPKERFEVSSFLTQVRARYHEAFNNDASRLGATAVVDGLRSVDEVAADVRRAVSALKTRPSAAMGPIS